ILVDAEVSSMNTSLRGSSLICILCHALRAAATSARSCSAACRLFFEGKAQMAEKPEDRSLADRRLLFRQSRLKLGQGDVRLPNNPARDAIPVPLQRIPFVSTKLRGSDAPGLAPTRNKPAHRADAHAIEFRDLFIAVPALDPLYNASSQVFRIRLSHPCWPPAQWEA